MLSDEEIMKQLINGNHLNDKELQRASKLIYLIAIEIGNRIN